MRLQPCGVVGEAACERLFRLIAEVALRPRALERPLEVKPGVRARSDLEAPGRKHWPGERATSPSRQHSPLEML
jgi:hypothetical protein